MTGTRMIIRPAGISLVVPAVIVTIIPLAAGWQGHRRF